MPSIIYSIPFILSQVQANGLLLRPNANSAKQSLSSENLSTPYSQISGISSYDYEDDFTSEDEQSEFSAMTNISRRTNKSDKSSTSKIPIKRSSSLRRRPDLVALGTSGPSTPSPKTSSSRQSHHLEGGGGGGGSHHQLHHHQHRAGGGLGGGGSSPTLPPSSPPAPVPEPKPEEGEDLLLLTDPEVVFRKADVYCSDDGDRNKIYQEGATDQHEDVQDIAVVGGGRHSTPAPEISRCCHRFKPSRTGLFERI